MTGSHRIQLVANGFGDFFHEIGVPHGPVVDPGGEEGSSLGHETGETFLVGKRRYAETGFSDQEFLELVQRAYTVERTNRLTSQRPGQLPDAVFQGGKRIFAVSAQNEPLVGSEFQRSVFLYDDPQRAQLRDLLVYRHLGEQFTCPVFMVFHLKLLVLCCLQ